MAGKVLGIRAWRLTGGLLHSVNQSFGGWRVGVNEAECRAGIRHRAPSPDCQCGLYALHPEMVANGGVLMGERDSVVGAVLAWGRIEVHATGFRAQYAEVAMLAYDDDQSYGLVTRVQALASEMGIECVRLAELVERASRLGKPIAPELRPSWLTVPPMYPYGMPAGGSVGYPPSMPYMPVATAFMPAGYITPPPSPPPRRRPP